MKKAGILNRDIASILARMGHTDTIMIADCGLPVPDDTICIDLSVKFGMPDFATVLASVADDMVIEKMTFAEEIKTENPSLHKRIKADYSDLSIRYITHENLKQEIKNAKAVIRTGEATPFANVIIQSGVSF